MKEYKPSKLQQRLPVSESMYHSLVGIAIGVCIGLAILGLIAFLTRDSRPTQYILELIRLKLGLN